jgi:glutamyl-tRNA synthetase
MTKKVITRFAPSPTGFLHIGGARAALFNYLFTKHHGGKFLLRIEDTDKERSTEEAIEAILSSMKWIGLDWDEEPVYQSKRAYIHKARALELLESGKAYKCFMGRDEIDKARDEARQNKTSFIINSPWRDADSSTYPKDIQPVIRLKAPREGETVINDLVQGEVKVANDHLDDMILLRSDGSPTYMMAVVVDDHDMGITHIIRGDDHLTNSARQKILYEAFGWEVPEMAHIPLIHGPDGAKLSKRHGALGVEAYRDMGYLPEALQNYLLRLGWSHGDDEIISQEDGIKWFGLDAVSKGPARIDFDKMNHVNGHYIKEKSNDELLKMVLKDIGEVSSQSKDAIHKAMDSIKTRSSLIPEITELAKIYILEEVPIRSESAKEIIKESDKSVIGDVIEIIDSMDDLGNISEELKAYASSKSIKLGALMKPIRAIITGRENSPSVFEIIQIIGKEASLQRLKDGT